MFAFTCPEDSAHPIRIENPRVGNRTAYCESCARHYPLCLACRYMSPCERAKDHGGEHKDINGNTWIDHDKRMQEN